MCLFVPFQAIQGHFSLIHATYADDDAIMQVNIQDLFFCVHNVFSALSAHNSSFF